MDHIGIDVHKNASQVCIRTETGQLIERRIRTDRQRFAKWLGKRDKARMRCARRWCKRGPVTFV